MIDPVVQALIAESAKESIRLAGRAIEPTVDAVGIALRNRLRSIIDRIDGYVREHRAEVANDIFDRAGGVLTARGQAPEQLERTPPALAAAVILNATASLGGEEIRVLFAGLLAGAATSGRESDIHPAIPELLRQLNAPSARLLALLWTYGPVSNEGVRSSSQWIRADGRRMENSRKRLTGRAVDGRVDVEELSDAVADLVRLGLAAEATWRAGERTPIGSGYSETNVRDHSEIELTALGARLCAACLGSRDEHPTP